MSVNRAKFAAHSYLDLLDLVEIGREATISDSVLFWVFESNLELLKRQRVNRTPLETSRTLLRCEGILS